MNTLTKFIDDKLLHHELIEKKQKVRHLSYNQAMADTDQFSPVELTLSDRLQMAIQGQRLYVVGAVCFSLICAMCVISAVVAHLLAVFCCGAPGVWS